MKTIAHTATIQQTHTVPYRTVLVDTGKDFVVWTETFKDDGTHDGYSGGQYFPKHTEDAFRRAYAYYSRNAQRIETYIADGNYLEIV